MMKIEALCVVLTLLLWQSSASWIYSNQGPEKADKRYSDVKLMSLLQDVKRTNWLEALCGKWDDWCAPDQDKIGLNCCTGYTCKCNLWNTNCRCKAKLFTG